jgi:hypothetical protein
MTSTIILIQETTMLIQSTSKDGLHYLTFDDEKHTYILDGQAITGVTNANKNGYPAAPSLIVWLSKQAAWYTIEQLKQFPEQVNRLPDYLLDEIAKKATQAGKKIAKAAADIGSIVHEYAEKYGTELDGDFLRRIDVHPDKEKIHLCIGEFIKWSEASEYVTIDAEQTIASVTKQFAGKYDRLVKCGSKIILIDFKTSSGIFAEHWQQVAGAYRLALKEWRDIEIDGVDLVRFGKDGSFEHKLLTKKSEMDDHLDQFLRNLQTAKYREKYEPARYPVRTKTNP